MELKQSIIKIISGIWGIITVCLSFIFRSIIRLITGFWSWLKGLGRGIKAFWVSIGPKWLRRSALTVGVVVLLYTGAQWLLKPNLTLETVHQVRYLNEGWDDKAREDFYYTPQGTELLGMHYDWMVNLELPLSKERFASADNMRGWGFIVDPGQFASPMNPGNLPVGLGRHVDPQTGKERLDLGCSMCHTGELHYKGTALRIDGGQAMQSVPTAKRGEFITTLAAAVIETYIIPSKWSRFADRVAGQDEEKREQLRDDFWGFLVTIKDFIAGPGAPSHYPTEEGRGRTDAVGRIANVVFGFDLNVPENYSTADAPVSYPFLWDIWRFDWVQYTGFTNQAMARNIGESLGVLAPIKLVDKDGKLLPPGEFGQTVIDIDGMHCVESTLRSLKPPKWPEDILGEIDIAKAVEGKAIFADQCVFCHGPHVSKPFAWPVADGPGKNPADQIDVNWEWDMAGDITRKDGKAFRDDWRKTMWALPLIDIDVIGTDATAANNFVDTKYDASTVVPGSAPVNAGDGLQILLDRLVPVLYENWGITGQNVPNYDGLNVPFRIYNQRGYKSRPLHGVWATPPFLHNGSVPTVYDLLSPMEVRPKTFAVGNREYDPTLLGYITEAAPGSFIHDTTVTGNSNQGHLFTDVDMPGRIGDLLSEKQRMAIIEYLKVMGNPDFTQALGGDPLNWDKYTAPPRDVTGEQACAKPPHAGSLTASNQAEAGS